MKKFLIATTALVATAGASYADVSVSGDGRMGVVFDGDDWDMSSRVRGKLTLSGETDGGVTFGGSFDIHNAAAAAAGTSGHIFASGAFGKLSMGDVDGAAKAAVGNVSAVGYTLLNETNKNLFINAGTDVDGDGTDDTAYPVPSALYEYSTGALTLYAGIGQIGGTSYTLGTGTTAVTADFGQSYSLGVKYVVSGFTLSAGYEATQDVSFANTTTTLDQGSISGFHLGADWTNGALTLKGRAGLLDLGDTLGDAHQWAVSADYAFGATTVTGYYRWINADWAADTAWAYGLGAAYDLGGGAAIKGGIEKTSASKTIADLGMTFSF
ncbi:MULTISPECIES: porin [Halocynthiibacter]|uniref:Porin n=1 Tax=Halocynthiibacter halioticoli TaxID=2986804 RepID=A0AAE3LTT0_9RHOB|nr:MULTISPECIES: porin [Halocynthiibacter]MCV6825701.1 porin [Halocynthiibacter halioticoli]MCW4058702.1 porin [Halocynthiibacter sp. SDUM655004]